MVGVQGNHALRNRRNAHEQSTNGQAKHDPAGGLSDPSRRRQEQWRKGIRRQLCLARPVELGQKLGKEVALRARIPIRDAGIPIATMKSIPNPPIPELGALLKFLLDCFDVRRDGSPLTHKQVQRLAAGKSQSDETVEKVCRNVIDAINRSLRGEDVIAPVTARTLEEWQKAPHKMAGLELDADKTCVLRSDQLVTDLIEFCWRHQYLLTQLKDDAKHDTALQYWLSGFVIPYATSTLVDYYYTENNPESGMPGGRLWYLPEIVAPVAPSNSVRIRMPSEQVLLWWEDLLGRPLEELGKSLCGSASDPENARRQIAAWKRQAVPPDSETIRRWSKQEWDYSGAFQDEPHLPIEERWKRCRSFLERKGMTAASNWIDGTASSPFEPVQALAKVYCGERLEQEIRPFREIPFKCFFESADPVSEQLPVEELLRRVATRWRSPTRVELNSRLMIGRAMNVAWDSLAKTLGIENLLRLVRWAGCSYNHFMMLSAKSDRISTHESMRIHEQLVSPRDPAFHPIAAMLDEPHWRSLPEYLRVWIRGEVRLEG